MKYWMRIAVIPLILMGCALPVLAARQVTVAELQQLLAAQVAAHKSDAEIAQKLSDLALTEELTPLTLQHIATAAAPGPLTAQVLELLADASALLAPPASELPDAAKPDMTAQRAMFSTAVDYVVKTLRHLPDFLATRETRSFDDSPNVVSHSGYASITPMHFVGTFHRDVTYRGGKEVLQAAESGAKLNSASGPVGLTTWGEFGPVLSIIVSDSLKGTVRWGRWEQGASGRVAVFNFAVPQASSHYGVDFCCAWQALNSQTNAAPISYHETPGYHGELFLDPVSGAIVRVTLEAELKNRDLLGRAAISVQYGAVEIGGANYICPTRSVAISQDMNRPGKVVGGVIPVTRINETTFTRYHRFGSTSRILAGMPDSPPAPAQNPPAATTGEASAPLAEAPASAESSAQTAEVAPHEASANSAIVTSPLAQSLVGDYTGDIGSKAANLRLKANLDGTLRGTLDNLDPANPWMLTLSDIQFEGRALRFAVPFVDANFVGNLAADGHSISGTWKQKSVSVPVEFALQKFIPAPHPSPMDGIWLEVQKGEQSEPGRNQLVFRSAASGHQYCTLDQLDIWTMAEECTDVTLNGNAVSFAVPVAGLHWKGELAEGGNRLVGNWSQSVQQGQASREILTPSDFHRQAALSVEKPRLHAAYDAAMPPVDAASLEAVLAKDIAGALKGSDLGPGTGAGVTVAVYEHGVRRIFSFGEAKPDAIYEIGAMTKTFTGLLLAQMAAQGKVKLDEPVRELFPAGAMAKPDGPEITLLNLATQRSGLPPMPDNMSVENMDQPYADYHAADLVAWLGKHGVANPTQASSPFGSLGFGLLGVALASRTGKSYGDLVKEEVAGPLGLKDTALMLTPEQQARIIAGHDQFHKPASVWESDAFAGAIGLRSTAARYADLSGGLFASGEGVRSCLGLRVRPRLRPRCGNPWSLKVK